MRSCLNLHNPRIARLRNQFYSFAGLGAELGFVPALGVAEDSTGPGVAAVAGEGVATGGAIDTGVALLAGPAVLELAAGSAAQPAAATSETVTASASEICLILFMVFSPTCLLRHGTSR